MDCLVSGAPMPFPVSSLSQLVSWLAPLAALWEPATSRSIAERFNDLSSETAWTTWEAQKPKLLAEMVGGPTAARRPAKGAHTKVHSVLKLGSDCDSLLHLGSLRDIAAASPALLSLTMQDDEAASSVKSFFEEDYPAF